MENRLDLGGLDNRVGHDSHLAKKHLKNVIPRRVYGKPVGCVAI